MVVAGQGSKGLQRFQQAFAYNIKSSRTLTEFLVTINLNQAFVLRDLVFRCIHALSRLTLHELAIGYAYVCCAQLGVARH